MVKCIIQVKFCCLFFGRVDDDLFSGERKTIIDGYQGSSTFSYIKCLHHLNGTIKNSNLQNYFYSFYSTLKCDTLGLPWDFSGFFSVDSK